MFRFNTQKDNNVTDKNTWNIKDTSDISFSRPCSSKDCPACLNESTPCNETPMHRSINTKSKTVRQENNKEYFHKVNATIPRNVMLSDIPGNWKISKSDGVKEHETSVSKTGNNYWPLGNVATVEESIVNGIDEKRLIMNNGIVQVFYFSRT